MRVARVVLPLGIALTAACSLITSLDDLSGGTDGSAVETSTDAQAACEAGLTACNGSCIDTTTEPASCGACGHDCRGAPCANGLCAPITLAQVGGSPHGIAAGGDAVYFTTYDTTGSDGGVFRIMKDGGAVSQLASAQPYPSIVVAAAAGIYWTNSGYGVPGSVMYSDGGSPTKLATASGTAFGLAVTSSDAYWSNSDKTGSIETAPLGNDGGAGKIIVPSRNTPSLVASDGTSLFWAEQSGSVMKSALDGTSTSTLVGNLSSVFGIAVDGVDVYFTDQTLGLVAKVSKNQGAMTKLATGQEDARCVVVSGGDVFWAAYANGAVRGYVGGEVRTYASSQNAPLCVAVDATWLYWTSYGDGTVKKTPR